MGKTILHYSIRIKIFGLYMVLLFITCIVLFLSFTIRSSKVYKMQADFHMADLTAMSTGSISNMIEQIDQLSVSIIIDQTVQDNLKVINQRYGKHGGNISGVSISVNEAAISKQVRGSVFNINGIISLRIYPVNGREIFVGTTNREYLEYSMSPDEIYAAKGAAVWGMAGDDHYLCLGRAILSTDNIQPLGYMVIICKNEYLSDKLSTFPNAYSGKVYLVDKENTIIAAGTNTMAGESFRYNLSELRRMDYSTISDPESGETSYYYIGKSMENGWTLVATVSTGVFRRHILLSILQMMFILITALTVSLIITMSAIRKLLAPTGELLESMSRFGEGKLDARVVVKDKDEIGQISQAYNQMADNIQNLMEKVYSLELANREAEIEFLKMQINPHFLYNSLDTISWLGYTSGNMEISDISVSLAKLLRASIRRADYVTVEEEMQIVESYLLIQKCRFEDKFTVECRMEESTKKCRMPGFLLQPLVENSIIHGLEEQIGKGYLEISVLRMDNWLHFTVKDNGKGMDEIQLMQLVKECEERGNGNSIGLKNVYRRLQLLYGSSCKFHIESSCGKGTRVSFRIPVMTENGGEEE